MNEGQGVILDQDQILGGGSSLSIDHSLKHKLNNQCIELGDHIWLFEFSSRIFIQNI